MVHGAGGGRSARLRRAPATARCSACVDRVAAFEVLPQSLTRAPGAPPPACARASGKPRRSTAPGSGWLAQGASVTAAAPRRFRYDRCRHCSSRSEPPRAASGSPPAVPYLHTSDTTTSVPQQHRHPRGSSETGIPADADRIGFRAHARHQPRDVSTRPRTRHCAVGSGRQGARIEDRLRRAGDAGAWTRSQPRSEAVFFSRLPA